MKICNGSHFYFYQIYTIDEMQQYFYWVPGEGFNWALTLEVIIKSSILLWKADRIKFTHKKSS